MAKSSCLSTDQLRQVFTLGQFADANKAQQALDHFSQLCPGCWGQLTALAAEDFKIDIEALERHAKQSFDELPLALGLGRLALVASQPAAGMALPPTHRYLLGKASWQGFDFWWLLIEESRLLALNSGARQLDRWGPMTAALERHFDKNLELSLLTYAYAADDLRVSGLPLAADHLLGDILLQIHHCRPEIKAMVHEVYADLHRAGRRLSQSLEHLRQAEKCLQDKRIPGRLAESRIRIALTRLSGDELRPSLAAFEDALDLIPQGTDPRLRLEILVHMAVIQVRLENANQIRPLLEEVEPFFESHGPDGWLLHRSWLWGLVYLDEGEFGLAESHLLEALEGCQVFGDTEVRARILSYLVVLYIQSINAAGLDRVLPELMSIVKQENGRVSLEQTLEWVRQVSTLKDLQALEESLTVVLMPDAMIPELGDLVSGLATAKAELSDLGARIVHMERVVLLNELQEDG